MHKLALLAILLTARAGDDSLQQLVEDLRQEAREEFEDIKGIDASELDAYVDAFVADGLARITRRVSMEIDDDGEAAAQFEWVQREPRPTAIMPLPCPETHRCGVCGRASSRHVASPFEVALISTNAEEAAPGLFHQRGKTARGWRYCAAVRGEPSARPHDRRPFNAADPGRGPPDAHRFGTRRRPAGPVANPTGRPTSTRKQRAYYSALVYFEDGGVDFEGGALIFEDGETVLPRRGRLVAFAGRERPSPGSSGARGRRWRSGSRVRNRSDQRHRGGRVFVRGALVHVRRRGVITGCFVEERRPRAP